MSFSSDMRMYWRFAVGLRGFLRNPITLEQSREIIKQRLADREKNLLGIVKKAVYDNSTSPYLSLLRLAGCEYGDFEDMVQSLGIESTLHKLREAGVYISWEEFKGTRPVTRGNSVFNFIERDFDNPHFAGHLETISGASRSTGTRTMYDFDYITAHRTVTRLVVLEAWSTPHTPLALWAPASLSYGPAAVLSYMQAGRIPQKWFTPVDDSRVSRSLKSKLGTNYIVYMSRLFGKNCPRPEYVPVDEAGKVAQWIADTIKKEGTCFLHGAFSLLVRISQAAKENGMDIGGTTFYGGSEPLTEAKRMEIESVGARICPSYVFDEGGIVGVGCLNSTHIDEVHFFKDSFALIQHQRKVSHADVSVNAFLFTSLLTSTPKVLLNVEVGDYGEIESRQCGCKLEKLGFTEHIYNIRSFDKLTGEGVTLIGTEMVNIIENILPAKYGGTSIDYQILEEEDNQGHTRLSIVVAPKVGAIDEVELITTILHEVVKGADFRSEMADIWSQAKTLQVKRMPPFITSRGKLLPLHIQKSK